MVLLQRFRNWLKFRSFQQLLFLTVASLFIDDSNLYMLLGVALKVVLCDILSLFIINYEYYQQPWNFDGFGLVVHVTSLVAGTFSVMTMYCSLTARDCPQYCSNSLFVDYGNPLTLTVLSAVMAAIKL